MIKNIFLTVLPALGGLLSSSDEATNLTGAWEGPKDLMINICVENHNQPYICQCGIFRTYGWVNFSTTITADSLIMVSTDTGSPFEGRFRIVSTDRLEGSLTMGNPEDSWFVDGTTDLIKQKPEIPGNINHNLEGLILPEDYGILSLDREKTQELLASLSEKSFGYDEKEYVEKLLNERVLPVSPDDMTNFRRVRSIQIDARDGIFSYPFFKCRFKNENGTIFFEKTSGSQRKSGYVYQNSPESLIFLGGWSVNDDPLTSYVSDHSVAGTIYRLGPKKAIMIFPTEENRVEIFELTQ